MRLSIENNACLRLLVGPTFVEIGRMPAASVMLRQGPEEPLTALGTFRNDAAARLVQTAYAAGEPRQWRIEARPLGTFEGLFRIRHMTMPVDGGARLSFRLDMAPVGEVFFAGQAARSDTACH